MLRSKARGSLQKPANLHASMHDLKLVMLSCSHATCKVLNDDGQCDRSCAALCPARRRKQLLANAKAQNLVLSQMIQGCFCEQKLSLLRLAALTQSSLYWGGWGGEGRGCNLYFLLSQMFATWQLTQEYTSHLALCPCNSLIACPCNMLSVIM